MKLSHVLGAVAASVMVQVILARYAVGGWVAFDVVLVGVVFVALQAGPVAGMVAGTLGGLLLDLVSGGVVGPGGLVKTIVGAATGTFGSRFVVARPWARAVIVGAASFAHTMMSGALDAVLEQAWSGFSWPAILGELALNGAAGYLVFWAIDAAPGIVARGRSRQRSLWGRRQW